MHPACQRCPLHTLSRVPFEGPVDAKLALIGEAPGWTEIKERRPFVGPSGDLVMQFLDFHHIDRSEVRIGNVLLCGQIDRIKEKMMSDPGPNGVGSMFEHALACCGERREDEGDLQSPVVLALGVSAAWGLMGYKIALGGKHPQRGSLFRDWKKRAVFPTWHPAMLLRAGGQGDSAKAGKMSDAEAQSVSFDVLKAWRFANGLQEEYSFDRCDPIYTEQFCQIARTERKLISLDIETDSLDAMTCNLTIVGIAKHEPDGKVLALSLWWPTTPAAHRDAIRALLTDPCVPKTLHNFPYDVTVLERDGIFVANVEYDTLLGHNAFAPECDHDLGSVACDFLITEPWKAIYYRGQKSIEAEQHYNAGDAARTLSITAPLKRECAEAEVDQVVTVDLRLAEITRRMRIRGVPIDAGVRQEIGDALRVRRETARSGIERMAADAVLAGNHPKYAERFMLTVQKTKRLSLASPYQLEALMDLLEVPCPANALTKTGMRSTKNEIIATIGHPFTRGLVDYRASDKLVSTFVDGKGLRLGADSRIHPDWKVFGAVTGRFTCRPSFMNWKKDIKDPTRNLRRMVVAPPGRRFVGADFAQLEFRIVALLAGQEDLLVALSDTKRDVHSENAARFYPTVWPQLLQRKTDAKGYLSALDTRLSYPVWAGLQDAKDKSGFLNTLVKLHPRDKPLLQEYAEQYKLFEYASVSLKRLRELIKRATYAALYGSTGDNLFLKLRSDEKLRDLGMEIEQEQCVRFVQMMPIWWPKIEEWRRKAPEQAFQDMEIRSALVGRRRPFPLGKFDTTQSINNPVQMIAADIMDLGMLDLWDRLDSVVDWIILQIHDALVVETDEARTELVKQLVEQSLTCIVKLNGHECLFPAEAKDGVSWDQV